MIKEELCSQDEYGYKFIEKEMPIRYQFTYKNDSSVKKQSCEVMQEIQDSFPCTLVVTNRRVNSIKAMSSDQCDEVKMQKCPEAAQTHSMRSFSEIQKSLRILNKKLCDKNNLNVENKTNRLNFLVQNSCQQLCDIGESVRRWTTIQQLLSDYLDKNLDQKQWLQERQIRQNVKAIEENMISDNDMLLKINNSIYSTGESGCFVQRSSEYEQNAQSNYDKQAELEQCVEQGSINTFQISK